MATGIFAVGLLFLDSPGLDLHRITDPRLETDFCWSVANRGGRA